MSDQELRAENDRLRARLSTYENAAADAKKDKRWYSDNDWKDWLKLSGLPLAFILACYTFYDDVYLRARGQDSVTVTGIEGNLRELQKLNEKAYALNQTNGVDGASSFEAANAGLRQRLISQTYAYWQSQPDFFQPSETQILADQLLLQGRTIDAGSVAATLDAGTRTPTDRVNLALFRGRILGAEGDGFDLKAARKQLGKAYQMTDEIPISSRALAMRRMIVQYRVNMELWYEQDCEIITPLVAALKGWSLNGTGLEDSADREAADMIETFEARCGS